MGISALWMMEIPSVTKPTGGVSISTTSYSFFRDSNMRVMFALMISSLGLGGIGPAVMKSSPGRSLCWRQLWISSLPMSNVLIPRMFSTPKPKWIFGFRMSRSSITTRFSLKLMIPPRLIATNVLPSPEMVLVTAINFGPGELSTNWRLVRTLRKLSAINDFGFLSTSSWLTGISFLYLGTMPRIPTEELLALAMSFNEVMLLCRI